MANRVFTEQEKQTMKNKYDTMGLRELSREIRASTAQVRAVLEEMGVVIRGRGRPSRAIPKKNEVHLVPEFDVTNCDESEVVSNDNVDSSEDEEFFRVD